MIANVEFDWWSVFEQGKKGCIDKRSGERRVLATPDLFAVDAQYHEDCRKKFMKPVKESGSIKRKRGRSEDTEITEAINRIFARRRRLEGDYTNR